MWAGWVVRAKALGGKKVWCAEKTGLARAEAPV